MYAALVTGLREAVKTAFITYIHLLHRWRKIHHADPGLSAKVLPDGWPGSRAREVFDAVRSRLQMHAVRRILSVVGPPAPLESE